MTTTVVPACQLTSGPLLQITGRCPNLIGFKDGVDDIEKFWRLFTHRGGAPS